MEVDITKIGVLIREERVRRGLTQEDLGQLIGVGKAQISKIESGKGLTIKTVTKVLEALHLTASIKLVSETKSDKRVIGYVVAVISEFARAYNMTIREASNYLNRYRGIDFLTDHYEAEHLLSIEDSVEDLARVCYNNGGGVLERNDINIATKRFQYLIEGITKDIVTYLMQDKGLDIASALSLFHNSETFEKLSDERSGLYIESSAYVYEILKSELKMGRIV